jgi:zinc protease
MTRLHQYIIVLAVAMCALSLAAQTSAPSPNPSEAQKTKPTPQQTRQAQNELAKIPIPKLPEFHPQMPKRFELPNGLVVFLQENHELPLIGGSMRIRGGSELEPKNKTGMLDVFGSVWRTGGTKTRTGDQLDDFLEARAAKLETGSNDDSTTIGFNCLKGDFDTVFDAFKELLFQPEFRDDKVELIKRQMEGAIARRNDDVDGIAGREATKLAYGADNPLAWVPEYVTVEAVTRQDLIDWHAKYAHPNNAILGIYGDFDPVKMEATIREAFGSWAQGQKASEPKLEFTPAKPGLYFIPKEDVDQSNIQMVGLGIERKNPDFFAVSVMNEILGGGFSSRLFTTLRSKLGLAYSVGGGVGSGWDHPGMQNFSIATKSASTNDSIVNMKKELANLLTSPPTPVEMKRAKDAILNSFVFNFDSKQKVLLEQMRYEFYGYPSDFLEQYRAGIEKVTVDDVNRVARKYVHPDQLAVLVVGNPTEIGDQVKSLGTVTNIDITIPPPPMSPGSPPAKPTK